MSSQSFTLLAIGVFVSLLVAVAAIDQYLFDEHPPSEVDGLIWRVENAFSRIKDLEAVVEVAESEKSLEPVRMVVRLLNRPLPALSVRYLDPPALEGQVFTVENDLLSHYVPEENLIVVKRWVGLPLAAVGLASLDLAQLRADWSAGKLDLEILQNVPGFSTDSVPSPVTLSGTLTDLSQPLTMSFSPGLGELGRDGSGLTLATGPTVENVIQGEYILEVRDASNGDLTRMIWISRETYYVQKVVFFSEGRRDKTIELQRITVDQGLTEDDVLTLPRGLETLRG
jgi:hypothetical protein